jgi:hypothetical protein
MLVTRSAPELADWDALIERANTGPNAEDKLVRTIELLASAQQLSRLRGDSDLVTELAWRLASVHDLLDLL